MKKLTKKQRHEVYKEALIVYNNHSGFGLCFAIDKALHEFDFTCDEGLIYPGLSPYRFMKSYPEIHKHKPIALFTGGYWWDKSDRKSRIEVLKQTIKETE